MMKREEKIANLEKYFESEETITAKTLTSLKIAPYLIQELIEEKRLVRVSRGVYMRAIEEHEEVELITPPQTAITFQELQAMIYSHEYQKAGESLSLLETVTDSDRLSFHLYATLLNRFVKTKDKKQTYLKPYHFDDYRLPEANLTTDNKIRFSISRAKFPLAIRQIREKYTDFSRMSMEDKMIHDLLQEVVKKEKQDRLLELSYQKRKDYVALKNLLLEKEGRGILTYQEAMSLQLVNTILLSEKQDLEVHHQTDATTVAEAIEQKDYALAENLNQAHIRKNGLNEDQNLLTLLLKELVAIEQADLSVKNNKKILSQVFKSLMEGKDEESILLLSSYLKVQEKVNFFPW